MKTGVFGPKSVFFRASSLWNIVFALTIAVYVVGLFPPVMEPDAAVYAEVSMEMHDRGDYLSIYHKGHDWLDKPHFPFWMSAFSYAVFGVNFVAYKLPAMLFVLMGAGYTFLFGRRYYSALHGWLAAIVLLTAQHIIISNQDVRAEAFMTGLMMMAMYHLSVVADWLDNPSRRRFWGHAALGALALACLMMTKGLFTIIPVGAAVGLSLLYRRQWAAILNWRWLVVGIMMVIFLFPALYGYYQQFDLHPEKTVFGKTNVSGVEFFLWTSQWGRFTNTGPITGKGDPFFFVHTLIWAFLPWAFAAYFALFRKARQLFRGEAGSETYTFFGFISLFLIFSASRFQLSFYLNPLFPFLSVLTVAGLVDAGKRAVRVFSIIHLVVCILLVLALGGLNYIFLSHWPHADTLVVLFFFLSIAFFLFSRRGGYLKKIFFATPLVVLAINYYINRDFYPELLTYQAETSLGYYLREQDIPADQVVVVGEPESSADVIVHQVIPVVPMKDISRDAIAGKYVFTTPEGVRKIDSMKLDYELEARFNDYQVTRLKGNFVNKKTRYNAVEQKLLLKTVAVSPSTPGVDVVGDTAGNHEVVRSPAVSDHQFDVR